MGIEYMGSPPLLVPGSGPTTGDEVAWLLPNVFSLGAGNRGGDTALAPTVAADPGTDLESTSGRLDTTGGAQGNWLPMAYGLTSLADLSVGEEG